MLVCEHTSVEDLLYKALYAARDRGVGDIFGVEQLFTAAEWLRIPEEKHDDLGRRFSRFIRETDTDFAHTAGKHPQKYIRTRKT